MLSYEEGRPIARDGKDIISIKTNDNNESDSDNDDIGTEYEANYELEPLLNMDERSVAYVAGPSGSGKTTFALALIKRYLKVFPEIPFYLFSRTDYRNDPAYQGMRVNQVLINENILRNPINIEHELSGGSILLFDDCNTIQDDKLKKAIDKLMADIMEVGRKLNITIIMTNHLVIPNEKKVARTILNELQTMTVFPKSGSTQQITYALKQYFGLNKHQIEEIIQLPSRWVMISKTYPMYVMHQHGIYIL